MFNFGDIGRAFNPNVEVRSNQLRDWYRTAQRLFRNMYSGLDATQKMDGTITSRLNDLLAGMPNDVAREGFLMGWQSDAYAAEHNLPFSIEGADRVIPEDLYGHTDDTEGNSILAGEHTPDQGH